MIEVHHYVTNWNFFYEYYWIYFSFYLAPSLIPSKSEFPISGSQSYGGYHKALGDSGPGDTGHEMHAKMEEAIEHALAIINGAAKFAEEAQLEQVKILFG